MELELEELLADVEFKNKKDLAEIEETKKLLKWSLSYEKRGNVEKSINSYRSASFLLQNFLRTSPSLSPHLLAVLQAIQKCIENKIIELSTQPHTIPKVIVSQSPSTTSIPTSPTAKSKKDRRRSRSLDLPLDFSNSYNKIDTRNEEYKDKKDKKLHSKRKDSKSSFTDSPLMRLASLTKREHKEHKEHKEHAKGESSSSHGLSSSPGHHRRTSSWGNIFSIHHSSKKKHMSTVSDLKTVRFKEETEIHIVDLNAPPKAASASLDASSTTTDSGDDKYHLYPVFDTSNASKRDIEDVYLLALNCIFFPTVLYDMMNTQHILNILQSAFQFSDIKHQLFMDKVVQNSNYDSVLESLQQQIHSLEEHSFYGRNNFEEESSYLQLLKEEHKRINTLINHIKQKILNTGDVLMPCLPPPCKSSTQSSLNYHNLFQLLLKTLLRYDLQLRHSDVTQSTNESTKESLATSDSEPTLISNGLIEWLLKEFSSRYGIRQFSYTLCTLEILSQLQLGKDFELLPLITSLFTQLLSMLYDREPVTTQEMKLLELVMDDMHAAIEDSIVHFTDRFPSQESPPQLSALLHLLDLLRELRCFTNNSSINSTDDTQQLIQQYITRAVEEKYQRLVQRATLHCKEVYTHSSSTSRQMSSAENKSSSVIPMSPVYLAATCDYITTELGIIANYSSLFKKYMNLVEYSGNIFARLIGAAVREVCSEGAAVYSARSFLLLISQLHKLNQHLAALISGYIHSLVDTGANSRAANSYEWMPLHSLFAPFLNNWFQEVHSHFITWMNSAYDRDKWQAVNEESKCSSSAVDVFCMFAEPATFIHSHAELLLSLEHEHSPMISYGKVISGIIGMYVDKLFDGFGADLSAADVEFLQKTRKHLQLHEYDAEDHIFPKKKSVIDKWRARYSKPQKLHFESRKLSLPFIDSKSYEKPKYSVITEQVCMRINNIDFARTQLDELLTKFPEFGESFSDSFHSLKKQQLSIIQLTAHWINNFVEHEMKQFVLKSKKKERDRILEIIVTFLDDQLTVLSQHLLSLLFHKVLVSVWNLILSSCKHMLLEENQRHLKPNIRLKHLDLTFDALHELHSYFSADGTITLPHTYASFLEQLNSWKEQVPS